ncbi:MAG: hypothetical protein WC856_09325 [Methylococcaceae bacterium]|jgi:hypothetical protein
MIVDIHAKMGELFTRRKLELFTIQLNIADMATWAEGIARKRKIDGHEFQNAVKELFWALGSIQLNIGHTLIALEECSFPGGTKGVALKEKEIPDVNLADLHFWHHLYNCYEAIYRFWERCVTVLRMRLTPHLKEKFYFDGYVNLVSTKEELSQLYEIADLRNYLKAWGKISRKRNEISHGKSNPFLNLNIDVEFSKLSDYLGKPIAKYKFELPNLKQETETVINYYRKSSKLLYSIKAICDCVVEPNRAI